MSAPEPVDVAAVRARAAEWKEWKEAYPAGYVSPDEVLALCDEVERLRTQVAGFAPVSTWTRFRAAVRDGPWMMKTGAPEPTPCFAVLIVHDDRWGTVKEFCTLRAGHKGDHRTTSAREPAAYVGWADDA